MVECMVYVGKCKQCNWKYYNSYKEKYDDTMHFLLMGENILIKTFLFFYFQGNVEKNKENKEHSKLRQILRNILMNIEVS